MQEVRLPKDTNIDENMTRGNVNAERSVDLSYNSTLDHYQLRAIDAFSGGKHVAVLGGAGTGKSFVIYNIIQTAKEKFGERHVAACATTNNAGRNI